MVKRGKRDLRHKQKRPLKREDRRKKQKGSILKRDPRKNQRRPNTEAKETYDRGKRNHGRSKPVQREGQKRAKKKAKKT